MKLKKNGLLMLCVGCTSSFVVLAADLRQSLLNCAAYDNYIVRLDCYDALAREQLKSLSVSAAVTATAAPSKQKQVAKWSVVESDQLVSFTTKDTPLTLDGVGLAKLIISCSTDKQANLAIDWGFDLGSNVYLAISTNHSRAQRVSAKMSSNGTVTYYSKPLLPLLNQMLIDDYLEVFADAGKHVLRARFLMADLNKAMVEHRKQCGL